MRTVWKYELYADGETQLRPMPRGATIVHVAEQRGSLCLWAEVDPNRSLVDRCFVVHGTGHPIEHDGVYVGTLIHFGGDLVWHVYEVGREAA